MSLAVVEIETTAASEHECPQCGSASLRRDAVNSAIWQGERLVVVEAIPALLCDACGERFYDDETVTQLDLLQGDGFRDDQADRFLAVPVISFARRSARGGAVAAEQAG